MKSLLILGAGQFGHVTKEIAEALGYEKIGFLDDHNKIAIGKLNDYKEFTEYEEAVIAIDDVMARMAYFEKLKLAGFKLPVLIHPSCYVSPSTDIGEGCIIEPEANIHTGCIIGRGTIVSMAANINHHTRIGDFCHIACNSTVMQNTDIPSCVNTMSGQLHFKEPIRRTELNLEEDFSFDSGM